MKTLIGLNVRHKQYGKGCIKNIDKKAIIHVMFDHDKKIHKFKFPNAFDSNYLVICNNEFHAISWEQFKDIRRKEKYYREINSILAKRAIKKVYHFTRLDNLRSILANGILSRKELEKANINYIGNDSLRHDKKMDCISLSVEYPNTRNLYSFRKADDKSRWVIIELDAEILLSSVGFFAEHNAATHSIATNLESRKSSQALEKMFQDTVTIFYSLGEEKTFIRDDFLNQNLNLPTSEQAEILLHDKIEKKYFNSIIFESISDMKPYEDLIKGISYTINKNMFYWDREYYYRHKIR